MSKDKAKDKEKAQKKNAPEYRAEINYPSGAAKPRMEVLRDNVFAGPKFNMKGQDDDETRRKAEEYASEMKRETRGFKKGGAVKSSASKRADGIAQRGKTKGRMV